MQYGLVARWRFDPSVAPVTPPDPTGVRPAIDRLNAAIVDRLAEHRAELAAPDCMERLAHGVFRALRERRSAVPTGVIRAASALCRGALVRRVEVRGCAVSKTTDLVC
ncbi:hypothetical protein [Nocardia bhagyanarayanae]|uniref:hypothetical protein n=1 Tax=Nocardia bhagyanarayanae TaxID=1215925 RepID=UPI0011517B9C|nr:hypothetical protein [Nocardia bhagyanarayanae]